MLSIFCGRMRVTVSFWFLAIVTLFLLLDRSGYAGFALLAVFIHETGHLVALFFCGASPDALAFSAEGICLLESKKPLSPICETIVLLAGSGANFLSAFCLVFGIGTERAFYIASLHMVLGIFNLLPLSSLDGGKLLSLFLSRLLPPDSVYRITSVCSVVTALLLLGSGVWLLAATENLSLLLTCLILVVLRITAKMTASGDISCNSHSNRL